MRATVQNASKSRNRHRRKSQSDQDGESVGSLKSDDQSISQTGTIQSQKLGVPSSNSIVSDSDSELSIFKKPSGQELQIYGENDSVGTGFDLDKDSIAEEGELQPYQLETVSTLVFISINGEKRTIPLTKRIMSYSELQRDIARYNHKSKKMFVVQDSTGEPILASSFSSYDIIRIKEVGIRPDKSLLIPLKRDWEVKGYYDAVGGNVNGDESVDDEGDDSGSEYTAGS